ncbi:Nif11-like leader peptide family RiPP precursor [Synechococcus sp. AH-707-D15]|nr:Nif11-like leader peptide family RiPP precursor [Synechococcus sp. AH-551-E11]MDB4554934.1 Nif11-like leader peptide family RiPP precursor [Synechococcus sp. AH-707-D15]MDB4616743.1 Nif11-like leader peptide family RiPP precursor [Synechococcus sp. AH-551-E11]MDC0325810.1 Nif11-like leader peptide family RiPP precursor [bacterium]MDC0325830.1 Nif11-like leader peptide family RiPP precursor [bacterium]
MISTRNRALAFAKEAGFTISADDITQSHSQYELSPQELECMVGGGKKNPYIT